jgi:hypothetical protein
MYVRHSEKDKTVTIVCDHTTEADRIIGTIPKGRLEVNYYLNDLFKSLGLGTCSKFDNLGWSSIFGVSWKFDKFTKEVRLGLPPYEVLMSSKIDILVGKGNYWDTHRGLHSFCAPSDLDYDPQLTVNASDGNIGVMFSTKTQARNFIIKMQGYIKKHGLVDLNSMYDLIGEELNSDGGIVGWLDLSNLDFDVLDDGYLIELPETISLIGSELPGAFPVKIWNGTEWVLRSVLDYGVEGMTFKDLEELSKSGEEFTLDFGTGVLNTYKIVGTSILYKSKSEQKFVKSFNDLNYFMSAKLIRKQWKPSLGEHYFCLCMGSTDNFWVEFVRFLGTGSDYEHIQNGNFFKTKEECQNSIEIKNLYLRMKEAFFND